MSIRRSPRPKRYTIISNDLLEDTRLNWAAKGMLCYLLSKPDNWRVNRDHLEKQTDDGQTKVRNALSDLEEAGYLVRNRYKDDDGQFRWEAVVYDEPQRKSAGQPIGGSTTDGSPTDGKSTVLVSTEVVTTEVVTTEEQNQSSPNGDALFDAPATAPSKAKKKNDYTEEFEAAWKIYPKLAGKLRASKNFATRRKEGHSAEDLTRAAVNYARACKKKGTDPMYIKHAEGFWGADKMFLDWLEDEGGKVNIPTSLHTDRSPTQGVMSRDEMKETIFQADEQDRTRESRVLTPEEIKAMMRGE